MGQGTRNLIDNFDTTLKTVIFVPFWCFSNSRWICTSKVLRCVSRILMCKMKIVQPALPQGMAAWSMTIPITRKVCGEGTWDAVHFRNKGICHSGISVHQGCTFSFMGWRKGKAMLSVLGGLGFGGLPRSSYQLDFRMDWRTMWELSCLHIS